MAVTPIKTVTSAEISAENWIQKRVDDSKLRRFVEFGVEITPTLADALLLRNEGNRRIYQSHVKALAAAMERGEWMTTHAGIAIDRNGRLLDGQHRLCAVRASGVAVRMDVHFGEAPESFDRIDVGRVRSAANLLEIGGHKNTSMLAAIGRVLISLESGSLYIDRINHSNHELLEYVARKPGIVEAALIANTVKDALGKMHSPAGFGAAALLIQQRMGAEEPAPFFEKVKTGLGLKSEFDACYRLRQRLQKSATGKLTAIEVCALTIKAFNCWHEGRQLKVLIWRAVDEAFPKVGE